MARVLGIPELLRRFKKTRVDFGKALEKGMTLAGLHLQRESQLIVPIDLGPLRASADTRKEGSGYDTEVKVGYYGIDYAVYVHEDLEARHAPGKTAKYLERPAKRERKNMARIIVAEITRDVV